MLKSQFQQITITKSPLTTSLSHRHPRYHQPSVHFAPAPVALRRQYRQCPVIMAAATEEYDSELVEEEGPVQRFPTTEPLFATDDDPTPIQVTTSVLLTGAITVFLFRSLRRRARRAKELQFRSSGAKKSITEEAIDNLKAMSISSPGDSKAPPSPIQAFLGAIAAGVIAVILYKFATTVEASLNRQTISDSYQVRQITITIRTIINGLVYLATFVFGINAVGLFLYAGQLTINSFMEEPNADKTSNKGEESSSIESSTNSTGEGSKENQSSDDLQ